MSRRSLLTRVLAFVGSLPFSAPALSRGASQVARSWNFGSTPVAWEPLEIATGDTLLVSAQVGGASVRAVLDSGSGATIVSTALATKLNLYGENRTASGLSAKAAVKLVHDIAVTLAGDHRRLPFAVIADLSAVSAGFGRPIDVVLGADLFADNCIALDFANGRIAVAKTGTFRAGSEWRSLKLSRGPKKELFVHASVAGLRPVPLMLDLGSSTALMLSSAFAREQGLMNETSLSTAAMGGIDGVKINDLFMVESIDIEGFGVSAIPTLGMRSWLVTSTVGNIGLPLIAQFDVVFDLSAGVVWLRPLDPRHRLPMLKDRSGLGFAASPTALTVVHVAANSPAEKAGWVVGDQIIKVNGQPIDANYTRHALWRWRFGAAGVAVKLETAASEHRTLRLADYY